MKIMIKNGQIITAEEVFQADLLIEDGRIRAIGSALQADGAEVVDASGRYIFPGCIDVHTHLDLDVGIARAVDDFYDGTVAAACGGTTAIVDHMAFGPLHAPLHHQFEVYKALAVDKAVIDYGFHGVANYVDDAIITELETMMADGISSLKAYMTYAGKLNDAEILQILKKMKEINGVTAFHCENHDVIEYLKKKFVAEGKLDPTYHPQSRPNLAEAEAVERVLKLARLAGDAPVYIVHLSTKEGLEAIRHARSLGQKNIIVETCPQYLVLTDEVYRRKDALKFVMSPPLRKQEDCDALWEGLADGSIQIVGTDHCPFNYQLEKQMGKDNFTKCPNGAPGIEERFMLLYTEGVGKGRLSLQQLVKVLAKYPAQAYGLYPEKGGLQPGADADFFVFNPQGKKLITHTDMHSACDYTAYEGHEVWGQIEKVYQRGELIVDQQKFVGSKGRGRFVKRKPFTGFN